MSDSPSSSAGTAPRPSEKPSSAPTPNEPPTQPQPVVTADLPGPAPEGHRRCPQGFEDVRKVMVLGAGGQGKTNLIRLLLARSSRALIVDPHREFVHDAIEVVSLRELAEYVGQAGGRFKIAYHNDHLEQDFPALCLAVYTMRQVFFGVGETAMFCNPSRIPIEFNRVLQYGRHRHVGHACDARRPANEVNHACTAHAWELYSFAMSEPRDLEYVQHYAGQAFKQRVVQLRPHVCLWQNLYDRTEPMKEFLPPKA